MSSTIYNSTEELRRYIDEVLYDNRSYSINSGSVMVLFVAVVTYIEGLYDRLNDLTN